MVKKKPESLSRNQETRRTRSATAAQTRSQRGAGRGTSEALRRSARIHALRCGTVDISGVAVSRNPDDQEYTPTPPIPTYMPARSEAIGLSTPRRRIQAGDGRPTVANLQKVSVSGRYCGLSGSSPGMRTNQRAHHVPEKLDIPTLQLLEVSFGEDPGCLSLHTRSNVMFMDVKLHDIHDKGKFLVIIPTLPILQRLETAIRWKKIRDWTGADPPHKNAAGFIHHEEVFPLDGTGRPFHLVPTLAWDKETELTITSRRPNGERVTDTYYHPFTDDAGRPTLPLAILHSGPHFVTFRAFRALTESKARLPRYMRAEERLVRKIGACMVNELLRKFAQA